MAISEISINNTNYYPKKKHSCSNTLQESNLVTDNKFAKKTILCSGALLITCIVADLCLNKGKNIKKIIKYITPDTSKEQTLKAIKECENLTFNTPNLKLIKDKYNRRNIYDLGLRYAVIGKNTKLKTGTALVKNEIPKIFNGINEKNLIDALNKLPQRLYDEVVTVYPQKNGLIKFEDKILHWESLGEGGNSIAYKISDEAGNTICFKHARRASDLPGRGHGIIDEVAILNEANKAGVTDVPKLYLANIFGKKTNPNKEVEGAWQIVEFIDKNKTVPEGLKFEHWLKSKRLIHTDCIDNPNNCINGFVVDMGGITSKTNSTVDFDLIKQNICDFSV